MLAFHWYNKKNDVFLLAGDETVVTKSAKNTFGFNTFAIFRAKKSAFVSRPTLGEKSLIS